MSDAGSEWRTALIPQGMTFVMGENFTLIFLFTLSSSKKTRTNTLTESRHILSHISYTERITQLIYNTFRHKRHLLTRLRQVTTIITWLPIKYSFLRTHVSLKATLFRQKRVTSGVPQGSHYFEVLLL